VPVDHSVAAGAIPRLQATAAVALSASFGQVLFDSFPQQELLMSNTFTAAKIELFSRYS
jgi:hypothetical protein